MVAAEGTAVVAANKIAAAVVEGVCIAIFAYCTATVVDAAEKSAVVAEDTVPAALAAVVVVVHTVMVEVVDKLVEEVVVAWFEVVACRIVQIVPVAAVAVVDKRSGFVAQIVTHMVVDEQTIVVAVEVHSALVAPCQNHW